MTQVPSATGSSGSSSASNPTNRFNELGIEDFLKLMISEMQNQDPLNPMDNKDMLAQISQMREISSNDKLTSTLDTVLRGQNFASATSLIGKKVTGLDNAGANITGIVERVSIADGVNTLQIGNSKMKLSNVKEIFEG